MAFKMVSTNDMKLGDVVGSDMEFHFDAATVVKIDGDWVEVVRPHIVTGAEYTGGLAWSIGVETVRLYRDDHAIWRLLAVA